MFSKPERIITLYFFKCRVKRCKKPYGLLFTMVSSAHVNWFEHASREHDKEDIRKVWPPYFVKEREFKAVKS